MGLGSGELGLHPQRFQHSAKPSLWTRLLASALSSQPLQSLWARQLDPHVTILKFRAGEEPGTQGPDPKC